MRRYGVVRSHDGYNVLDEFKCLDEFNSFHTSHNRRITSEFAWIKFDGYATYETVLNNRNTFKYFLCSLINTVNKNVG